VLNVTNVYNFSIGDCFCRDGVTGRYCNQIIGGLYLPSFNHYQLEAESGEGKFQVVSQPTGYNVQFSGYGYAALNYSNYL